MQTKILRTNILFFGKYDEQRTMHANIFVFDEMNSV